jgi:hypothetical protein
MDATLSMTNDVMFSVSFSLSRIDPVLLLLLLPALHTFRMYTMRMGGWGDGDDD